MATITIGNASISFTGQSLVLDQAVAISNASVSIAGQFVSLPVQAEPVVYTLSVFGTASSLGFSTTDPAKDQTFSCSQGDQGIITYTTSLSGSILNPTQLADPITYTLSLSADALEGQVAQGTFSYTTTISAFPYSRPLQTNWVTWSKIGSASVVQDQSNLAGSAPMEWPGWAYQAKKLGDNVVVYGSKGISIMFPVTEPLVTFGFRTLSMVGLKSPYSVAGNESIHFFITEPGDLWKLTSQGPERLGYSEYLGVLTSPVMLYDEHEREVYISDGTTGYTFADGLGGGYATLSGVSRGLYASSESLTGIPFSIMTDILDLGHRGLKTITGLEVGTNSTESLYAALDFRYTKDETWRTSPWTLLNPEGYARLTITAVEFRVRLKQTVFDELRIDYINLKHQRSDRRFLRGPLFEQPDQGAS